MGTVVWDGCVYGTVVCLGQSPVTAVGDGHRGRSSATLVEGFGCCGWVRLLWGVWLPRMLADCVADPAGLTGGLWPTREHLVALADLADSAADSADFWRTFWLT